MEVKILPRSTEQRSPLLLRNRSRFHQNLNLRFIEEHVWQHVFRNFEESWQVMRGWDGGITSDSIKHLGAGFLSNTAYY